MDNACVVRPTEFEELNLRRISLVLYEIVRVLNSTTPAFAPKGCHEMELYVKNVDAEDELEIRVYGLMLKVNDKMTSVPLEHARFRVGDKLYRNSLVNDQRLNFMCFTITVDGKETCRYVGPQVYPTHEDVEKRDIEFRELYEEK